jgi:hypothetical protein
LRREAAVRALLEEASLGRLDPEAASAVIAVEHGLATW